MNEHDHEHIAHNTWLAGVYERLQEKKRSVPLLTVHPGLDDVALYFLAENIRQELGIENVPEEYFTFLKLIGGVECDFETDGGRYLFGDDLLMWNKEFRKDEGYMPDFICLGYLGDRFYFYHYQEDSYCMFREGAVGRFHDCSDMLMDVWKTIHNLYLKYMSDEDETNQLAKSPEQEATDAKAQADLEALRERPMQTLHRYDIMENDEGEILFTMISFDSPLSESDRPLMYYDGGPHAIFVKNDEAAVICDYIHPAVRETLEKVDKVLIAELQDDTIKEEYYADLLHVEGVEEIADVHVEAEDR